MSIDYCTVHPTRPAIVRAFTVGKPSYAPQQWETRCGLCWHGDDEWHDHEPGPASIRLRSPRQLAAVSAWNLRHRRQYPEEWDN